MVYFLRYLENQFSNRRRTSPLTPLRSREGSLAPHSLVGKGAGGLGHFPHNVRG